MLRIYCTALIFANTLAASSHCNAQEESADPQSKQRIERLSDGSYSSRQQATLEMWRGRKESRDRVQRAARDPDPEISGRAQWILRQWRRGSLPGTPPEISRLLAKAQGTAAIDQLLIEGQFAGALVAVEESAGTLEYETIRQRVHQTLLQRFPTCVGAALRNHRLPEFLDFIDAVADSKEMAVCRVQLMQQLEMDVDAEGLLPTAAKSWTEIERIQAEALVLLILGRFDQAIEVAKQGSDKPFLFRCRAIAGRWNDALEAAVVRAREAEVGAAEYARLWAQTLICADRAGDRELFQQATEALYTTDLEDAAVARDLRWRTLASHGEVDAALEMLDQYDPESAALVAIDASRVEHAFEVLGFPLDELDSQLIDWVDRAVGAQQASQSEDLLEPVKNILTLVRCMISIGREDAAHTAVRRLCSSPTKVGTLQLRDYVLSSLVNTRRNDWVAEFAISDDQKTLSPVARNILARTLPDADSVSLEVIIEGLASINRGQPTPERVADACSLMRGEIPDGFDPPTHFKKLYDFSIQPRRYVRGRPISALNPIRANLNLVRFFSRLGKAEYATGVLQKLSETGDQEALLKLAEQELDAGSTDVARSLFDTLRESLVNEKRSAKIAGASNDLIVVQSLIGDWTIARRAGDDGRAQALVTELRLALCSPSTRLRNSAADYLVQRDQQDLAIEVFEGLLPMVMFETEQRTGIYDVARSYSLLARDSNLDEAARWFDLAICEIIRSADYRPGSYITLPLYVRRWSVEAALKRNDSAAIRRHIDRIMDLDPLDIDLAERILPELREAGLDEVADEALDRILAIGQSYMERFPDDAMTANNLAWVSAMNGRYLDEALQLSRRAVYCQPESAIYRDTLAEVLFRLNRKREALQIEEACLIDDPSQWHLHQQVEKYREASES